MNLCSTYATTPDPACSARFAKTGTRTTAAEALAAKDDGRSPALARTDAVLRGMTTDAGAWARRPRSGARTTAAASPLLLPAQLLPGQQPRRPVRRIVLRPTVRVRVLCLAECREVAARLPAGVGPMRRRGAASIAANPVLIGAATVLVIVVAVFLAYNANSGLPFVPTYQLKVEVPNAANLVKGNEVRVGGARVGVVDAIDPVNHADGSVTARLVDEARDDDRAAAEGLDGPGPPEVRARA